MRFLRSDRALSALENIRSQILEVGKMNRVSMYVALQSLPLTFSGVLPFFCTKTSSTDTRSSITAEKGGNLVGDDAQPERSPDVGCLYFLSWIDTR